MRILHSDVHFNQVKLQFVCRYYLHVNRYEHIVVFFYISIVSERHDLKSYYKLFLSTDDRTPRALGFSHMYVEIE